MSGLTIFLLGPPRVELNGTPVEIKRRKALAMLVYLAITGQTHSRDAMATLFYPDYSQSRARAYLRRDLAVLNTGLAGDWLATDRDTVELKHGFEVDVANFQALVAECREHDHPAEVVCPACVGLLKEAIALYTDHFLAGFTLRDCPEFDEWQFFQSESLRQALALTLERLVAGLSSQQKPEAAIPYARRWVSLDPLHEPAQRQLIQLYAEAGQPSAALRQFDEYQSLLEEELGLPPEEETLTLYEAIKAKRLMGTFLKTRTKEREESGAPTLEGPKSPVPSSQRSAPPVSVEKVSSVTVAPSQKTEQEIRFCTTSDGVRIAYALTGQGPPLVKAANWLSHLEYDWQSPVWQHWLAGLSQARTLVRYDRRGCGLSDWDVDAFSLAAYVQDMEAVVDALGLTRFPLLGVSVGGPVAITYAAHHPEKVSHLILYGSYARGRMYRQNPQHVEEARVLLKMMEVGWGKTNPAFRQLYTSLFIPEGTSEQIDWFNDLQRISTSPEIAVRMSRAAYTVDVTDLAPRLRVPTLILHAHDDAVVPFEESRHLAALIPNARFVPLEGKNHILLADEPAWARFLTETNQFLQTEAVPPVSPAATADAAAALSSAPVQLPARSKPLTPPHNLPPQPTEFLGREKELAEIRTLLVEEAGCRLLTLVGPGGIGKTRLALEAAARVLGHFPDGVYFVPLAPLGSAEPLVATVAEAIDFRFYVGATPKAQLLDYFQDKRLLLFVDNFEHVLAGAELLTEILQNATQLKILVTSRERLNLSGETVFTVGSMEIPSTGSLKDTLEFDAAKLFLQRARLIRPSFEPQTEDRAEIKHVCHLTQGMPLALVLAAGWLNMLSVRDIAAELSQSLDILETELGDVPERQRSVRAVFDSSWRQMSPDEQHIFMRLSVFRGGFTHQAARLVTKAGLPTLRALINKSLITLGPNERYEIHELLRQYGELELKKIAQQVNITRQKHSDYYLDLLHQHETNIIGPGQRETLNQIEADLDNVRAAWKWAVEHEQVEAIEHSLESLYQFYWIRSHFQEGEQVFGMATTRLQALGQTPYIENVLLKLLSRQGTFCYALGLVEKATGQLQQGLELARRLDDKKELAFVLNYLGELTRTQGKFTTAIQLFEESLALSREINEPLYIAQALKGLGWVSGEEGGAYAESKGYYEEALTYYRAADHQAEIAFCLDKLGLTAWDLGDYWESQKLFQESLDILRNIGDPLGIAKALGGLAIVGRSLGGDKLVEAELFARESLATCRATGHKLETANRLIILGIVLLSLDKFDEAQQHLEEAIEVSGKIQYDIGITMATNYLSEVAINRQAFQEARKLLIESLQRALNNHRGQDMAEILSNYAALLFNETVAQDQDDDDLTIEKATAAIELLTVATNHPSAWQDTKDKRNRLLTQIEKVLTPEAILAAQTRANHLTVEQATIKILQTEAEFATASGPNLQPEARRFVEERLLASGGMGQVFLGRDMQTNRPVAIKRLKPDLLTQNPEAVQRFIREGEALRQLNHPNIVKMLAMLDADDPPLIVMEYVAGGTLSDLLARQPQLPLEQTLGLSLELADALARVHHQGILHRDIKPGNVLLAEDGSPRLTDFGVAYLAQHDVQLTQEGSILGTTVYLSPEAWRGETLDTRSDIWSFGAMLFEMLTGQPPFCTENPAAIMTAILNNPLPELNQFRADVPPILVELIKQMLVKDRRQRLDSMRQVAATLEAIQRDVVA